MKQRPDAPDLIGTARRALLDEVAQELSGRSRYVALMVANALAIALRGMASDTADRQEEIALFRELYGAEFVAAAGADGEDLIALNRRLSQEIRSGKWDAMPAALRTLLREQTRLRLACSNPKYLARYDSGV